MDKNEQIIAITRILPGLENFLRDVLANESLSAEAERQRLELVKEIEELTKPPLPPRPANLKSQSRTPSVEHEASSHEITEGDKDFASVQRKLSNIFYLRKEFEELKDHFENGTNEEGNSKNPTRKTPVKSGKKKPTGKGRYEPPQIKTEVHVEDLESGVLSEEEGSRVNNRLTPLARGTQIRASLSRGKWFARKEKSIIHDVYVSDLQLPTISGHLMEVRTNKRRWCVLIDQHLYIFKNQEEPAHLVIALPGCDISTVPRGNKVSYSFKITQGGVAAITLGIEEEKDLSAWLNALITASVAKNPLSPQQKMTKTLPRGITTSWPKDDCVLDGQPEGRRHTFGSYSGYKVHEVSTDIDIGTYEQPVDSLGQPFFLDTENYNPPLPPLPGELGDMLRVNSRRGRPRSRYSGIYEEVGEEFISNHAEDNTKDEPSLELNNNNDSVDMDNEVTLEKSAASPKLNGHRKYSQVGTSDSEYSSEEDEVKDDENRTLFHDRWALHSGILHQKRPAGWNRRYCKVVENSLKGFRNPYNLTPVLELNLSACNVRAAEAEGKRKCIFQLSTAEGESLYFNADTKESLERWIEVISIAATSRLENSVTMSEEELDKVEDTSDEHHKSCDSLSSPVPVPERVESLRRTPIISAAVGALDVTENSEKQEESHLERPQILPPHDDVTEELCNPDPTLENHSEKSPEQKDSDVSLKQDISEKSKEKHEDVWKKRDVKQPYATTPRTKSEITKLSSSEDSSQTRSNPGLDVSSKQLTSSQGALYVSKKQKYRERLKKYLDKNDQFSGFILELRIKQHSTNLTRRWAVVQNGFLRIYENYGCAAPFLRISLVEAFLKDFSNVAKSRFCFMLEYGAGEAILLQTNTNQELKKWKKVINLSIACHADLFGSGVDLRRRERITGNLSDHRSTHNGPTKAEELTLPKKTDEVDGPPVTSPGSTSDVFETEVTSSKMTNGVSGHESDHDDKESVSCTPTVVKEMLHRKSYSMTSSSSLESDEIISRSSQESFTYRSSLIEMVKHRGYLRVSRGTGTRGTGTRGTETRATEAPETRATEAPETRGAETRETETRGEETRATETRETETRETETRGEETRGEETRATETRGAETPETETRGAETRETETREAETRGIGTSQLQFCELKGSLFSVYQNEKSENAKQVFNLLYDRFRELPDRSFSFTLKSDSVGTVEFECETEENFEIWKGVISSVALQDNNNCQQSPRTNAARYCTKCTSDQPVARKRSSFRTSYAEEEAKHHDVLRSLNEELKKGELKCDGSDYRCYVYEVRDSSGNKTIIRRWCVVTNDVIQIFERETSRDAVTHLSPSAYRLVDIENPRDFPFAFKLELLDGRGDCEETLVIQASNVKDFRGLMRRIKNVGHVVARNKQLSPSKSESNIQLTKRYSLKGATPALSHSKSELSIRKEVKRIFSLARKSSKGDLLNDTTPPGHDTWPKVIRREKRSSRRALSDTSTERPVTRSLIENFRDKLESRKSMGYFYDSEGKFSGYLTEVRNSELCRSEVRKWCVVQHNQFSAYDDKNVKSPSTVIDLKDVQLVDLSHVYSESFEFRTNDGVSRLYRAASDFHKWFTVLTLALDIVQKKPAQGTPNGSSEKLASSAKRSDVKKDDKPSQGYLRPSHDEDTAL